ncbi:MAG: molecular chaperone DnaK, partial [Oscillospiraceae bacterium]|nr:molecular chaperone DnaK [Oscillospiraceae bacterium]
LGDKVSESEKAPVKAAIEKLKEVNKGSDVAAIKTAIEEAKKAFYPMAEKLYQQANPQGAQGVQGFNPGDFNAAQGGKPDDGVVDADFEEVKD